MKWSIWNKSGDFKGLGAGLNIDQVVARVLINRGLNTMEEMREFLSPSFDVLGNPHLLKGMDEAIETLSFCIDAGAKIRVIGDYDADGITSTFILLSALKTVGADVDYSIPHRIEDGYGVNPDMVQIAYEEGVELIITCDNGIAASSAVELAKNLGMSFVITDHHKVPFVETDGIRQELIPNADAVIDPWQSDCPYPYKNICGAVVAWKVMIALFEYYDIDAKEAFKYLQFAALGTVCDIMELTGENRCIVYHGLSRIENTNNTGLKALLLRTKLNGIHLSSFHLGFIIGPCLNATGRLETAGMAVDLLLEDDIDKALALAQQLVDLNEQRKALTVKGVEAAFAMMEQGCYEQDNVLVIYMPQLHESLNGLVAAKIKEAKYKPTIVLSKGEGLVKGSGRSIEAYNMFEELTKVKDVFLKMGGHPMAAGMSLEEDKVDELRYRLNQNCTLTPDDLEGVVHIDVAMPLSYISFDLINQLERLAPFGNGNPKPVFAVKSVRLKKISYIGAEKKYLKLTALTEQNRPMDALYFKDGPGLIDYIINKYGSDEVDKLFSGQDNQVMLDIIYTPSINEFRDRKSIQIQIDEYR